MRWVLQHQCKYGCGSHEKGHWYERSSQKRSGFETFLELRRLRKAHPRSNYRVVIQ